MKAKKRTERHSGSAPDGASPSAGPLDRIALGWKPYAVILMMVVLVYVMTTGYSFVNLDDRQLVSKNQLRKPVLNSLRNSFTQDVFNDGRGMTYYRPLLTLSFKMDAWLGGTNPRSYHLSNVFIHVLAVLLLFWMLKQLWFAPPASLAAALFFGLHPVLAQSVAWVPGRNDSLLGLFSIASFGCFVKYWEQNRREGWGWLLASLIFFGAALLTKETAVLLPAVMLVYLGLVRPEYLKTFRFLRALTGWAVLLSGWLLLRAGVAGRIGPGMVTINPITTVLSGILSYAGKAVFPAGLSPVLDFKDISLPLGMVPLALISAAIMGGLRSPKRFWFGITWFLLFLLPTMIFSTAENAFLDHRMYLPLVGIVLALHELKILRMANRSRTTLLIALGLTALGAASLAYARVFRDDIACWSYTVRRSPHSALAHNQLGYSQSLRGNYQEAKKEYLNAIRMDPRYNWALFNLGTIYLRQDSLGKAEKYLLSALANAPDFPEASYNMGKVRERMGRYDEAAGYYLREEAANGNHLNSYISLGAIYQEQGKIESAIAQYRKALVIDSMNPDIQVNLGVMHQRAGDLKNAERSYQKAITIAPGKFQPHYNLGVLYRLQGRKDLAEEEFERAKRSDPRLWQSIRTLKR